MTDSKIYAVLTHFDRLSQNRLRKYIRSPYFNVNENLMCFYDLLTDNINANGKAEKLEKEAMWSKLYANEPYNDVRFRKLASELLKLTENFLAQEVYDDNKLLQGSHLLEAVGKRKIEKLYNSSVRNVRLLSEQMHNKSADFYFYQYLIEKNYYELTEVELKRSEKSNVEEIINNLDYFFLAEKMKWYSTALSRGKLMSHEYKLLFIDEIIEHIKKYKYEQNPAILVYSHVLLTQIEPENVEHYYSLRTVLNQKGSHFSKNEQYELYSASLNYCILKMNQGKQDFWAEFHNIIKDMLARDILFHESKLGELNPWLFKNIVQNALRLGEYTWTEKFIKDYQYRLPADLRENAVSYNLAQVYFYKKDYDKVISILQFIEYDDLTYNLGSKAMLIAIYYERDEFEALLSLTETFKTYLNRHKDINTKMRVNYLNYILFVRRLTKIMPGDSKAVEFLRKEISDAKGVASERWLLEKLTELD